MTLSLSTRWSINQPQVVHEILDDEVVVIDFNTGSYYSLNRVGTDVWALIDTGAATDEIIRDISRRYDGDLTEVEQAVVRFIDELRQEGLIMADGTSVAERTVPAKLEDMGPEKRKFEVPVLRQYTDLQELILLDPIHEVDVTGWPNQPKP